MPERLDHIQRTIERAMSNAEQPSKQHPAWLRRTIERNQHLRFNTDGTEGVEFVSRRHPKATPRLIATAIDECLREEPAT